MLLTVAVSPTTTESVGLAQYSWTDTIIIYKDATSVYANIRTFTNNETDFIIISEGRVVRSGDTYYGLELGQKLCFTVEAKPTDLVVVGDTATVGSIIIGIPQRMIDTTSERNGITSESESKENA